MRDAFVSALHSMAKADPSVILVTGDLGFGVLDEYARELPQQFLNVGVEEQNMAGLAAGLALSGHKVFTYSIANFPTLRCLEQIRNDICYHDADVTIVAIGGGLSYGPLGFSHQATEDLAIMRALPGMKVVAPGDDLESAEVTDILNGVGGPAYLRLDRSAPPIADLERDPVVFGKLAPVSDDGDDVLLVSTGALLRNSDDAARRLRAQGLGVTHLSCPWIKPFDTDGLLSVLARGHRLVVTVEEHSIIGGLGSAVAETVTSARDFVAPAPVLRCGLPDVLPSIVGSQDYLREEFGLDGEAISRRVGDLLVRPAGAGAER